MKPVKINIIDHEIGKMKAELNSPKTTPEQRAVLSKILGDEASFRKKFRETLANGIMNGELVTMTIQTDDLDLQLEF
jgi:hypothetical protein